MIVPPEMLASLVLPSSLAGLSHPDCRFFIDIRYFYSWTFSLWEHILDPSYYYLLYTDKSQFTMFRCDCTPTQSTQVLTRCNPWDCQPLPKNLACLPGSILPLQYLNRVFLKPWWMEQVWALPSWKIQSCIGQLNYKVLQIIIQRQGV